jgi:hypothetical protein
MSDIGLTAQISQGLYSIARHRYRFATRNSHVAAVDMTMYEYANQVPAFAFSW